MNRKQRTPVIRYSCLTGKAVWIYYSPSDEAMWKAYQRARKAEVERVRNWGKTVAQRKQNILRLLSDCTAPLGVIDELPPEKRDAAKRLLQMADTPRPCHRDFYNHLMAEAKNRRKIK
jgi:hypothetical protein